MTPVEVLGVRTVKRGIAVRVKGPEDCEIFMTDPEHAQVQGLGAAGARAVKAAGVLYVASFAAMTHEERCRLLVQEARERCERAEERVRLATIAAGDVARDLAGARFYNSDEYHQLFLAGEAETNAVVARDALHGPLGLLLGEHFLMRWEMQDEKDALIAEALANKSVGKP